MCIKQLVTIVYGVDYQYLILFTHAFVPERQYIVSNLPSQRPLCNIYVFQCHTAVF